MRQVNTLATMPPSRGVLKIRFNQDQGCFAVAKEGGAQVFNVEPLAEKTHIDYAICGGVGHVEMLDRTNLVAVVGGGQSPKYPDRNVLIWDDVSRKFVYEYGFPSSVLSVRMRRDKLVVVLSDGIHVFSFPQSSKLLKTIETSPNPKGLCEVCSSSDCQLMAFPGPQKGTVRMVDLLSTEAPDKAFTETICSVHQHELSCLAIDQQGALLASTSVKGTLIRIHSTQTRQLLVELRRGVDMANIYCLNFSLDSNFLCCCSDKGTVHVYAVKDQSLNKKSSFAQVGLLGRALGSYVDSQWGLALFSVPNESPCVCAFLGDKKTVVAVCMDGSLYKYSFNLEGSCVRDSYEAYLDISDNQM